VSGRNLSLAQHLAAGQLPMFMTANEIKEHLTLHDVGYPDFPVPLAHQMDEFKKYDRREVSDPKTEGQKTAETSMLSGKSHESKEWLDGEEGDLSLDEDIAKNGVRTPMTVLSNRPGSPMLYNGHHRLASMLEHRPNELINLEHL